MDKLINEKVFIKGKTLKNLLSKNNLTQNDLADTLGIDRSTISRIITNKKPATRDLVEKISQLLEVDEKEFININKPVDNNFKKTALMPKAEWNNEKFKELLEQKNYMLIEFCKKIKTDRSNFSSYSRGKSLPSVENLVKMCNVLGCSSMDLVGVSEEEINDYLGYEVFEVIENDKSVIEDKKVKEDIKEEKYNYVHFTNENVIHNLNIINENIILLVKDFSESIKTLTNTVNTLVEKNNSLEDKIKSLETIITKTNVNSINKEDNTVIKNIETDNKEKTVKNTVSYNNRYGVVCSDKEMQAIINGDCKEDNYESYKGKIYKLAAYMSRKKNLIFNQIMHDNYEKFKVVYGINLNELKKDTNTSSSLEAIYTNELTREIFFDMVCSKASSEC